MFAVAAPVLRARPVWLPVEHAGGCRHLLLRRAVCCLAYETPDHGYCSSCPCIADSQRERVTAACPTDDRPATFVSRSGGVDGVPEHLS
jgi:hypothetical protein